MSKAPRLRWERQEGRPGAIAYIGDVTFGMIGQVMGGPLWYYSVDGVRVKWITKGFGHVGSEAQAMRAVRRAWRLWWKAAGL